MKIDLDDILLIKHFLKNFEIYFEKTPYESIDELNNTGKVNLIKNNNQVGFILNNKIIIDFHEFKLKADISKKVNYQKPLITIKYSLENNKLDKIYGEYSISSNYNFKNKYVVKHILSVIKNNKKVNYYKFYTLNNMVYIHDIKNNEYILLDNDSLKHGIFNSYTSIENINDCKMISYLKRYYNVDNEEFFSGGGYIYSDNDKLKEDYFSIMNELDTDYLKFIEKNKDELNNFCDGLFDNIVNNSLYLLTDNEKEALFCTHNNKVKINKKNNYYHIIYGNFLL